MRNGVQTVEANEHFVGGRGFVFVVLLPVQSEEDFPGLLPRTRLHVVGQRYVVDQIGEASAKKKTNVVVVTVLFTGAILWCT